MRDALGATLASQMDVIVMRPVVLAFHEALPALPSPSDPRWEQRFVRTVCEALASPCGLNSTIFAQTKAMSCVTAKLLSGGMLTHWLGPSPMQDCKHAVDEALARCARTNVLGSPPECPLRPSTEPLSRERIELLQEWVRSVHEVSHRPVAHFLAVAAAGAGIKPAGRFHAHVLQAATSIQQEHAPTAVYALTYLSALTMSEDALNFRKPGDSLCHDWLVAEEFTGAVSVWHDSRAGTLFAVDAGPMGLGAVAHAVVDGALVSLDERRLSWEVQAGDCLALRATRASNSASKGTPADTGTSKGSPARIYFPKALGTWVDWCP